MLCYKDSLENRIIFQHQEFAHGDPEEGDEADQSRRCFNRARPAQGFLRGGHQSHPPDPALHQQVSRRFGAQVFSSTSYLLATREQEILPIGKRNMARGSGEIQERQLGQ